MVYIIPYYRLTGDIARILCDNFQDLSVYKFIGKEFDRFHQIAVLGIRKERENGSEQVPALMASCADNSKIPLLSDLPEGRYPLPSQPLTVSVSKGTVFNQLELARQLAASSSISKRLERSPLDSRQRRPLLPLNVGQVGLIGGSGLINGLVQCDSPHIVKGRVTKGTVVAVNAVETNQYGEEVSREQSETITNKLTFNILTAAGFRSLTQAQPKNQKGECQFAFCPIRAFLYRVAASAAALGQPPASQGVSLASGGSVFSDQPADPAEKAAGTKT